MAYKWENTPFKGGLSRARGLGSAQAGVEHWLRQRLTAFALIPLSIWMVFSLLSLRGLDHAGVVAWLQSPLNAVLSLLFITLSFWHARLGLQVVIEDYIHAEGIKILMLWTITLALLGLGVACVFAILKVSLGV